MTREQIYEFMARQKMSLISSVGDTALVCANYLVMSN